MFGIARFAFISALTFALGACGEQSDDAPAPSGAVAKAAPVAQVDTDRIAAAADEPEMWPLGAGPDQPRHAPRAGCGLGV